jgi:surfeit locus 1 family protein
MFRLLFSRRWWWTTLIVIVAICVAIRLGFWQLDRNAQRQATISHIMEMQALPVLDLNLLPFPSNMETMEYRQVTVTGVFDFDHQVALRNQVRARMSGTDPGIALITPLILADGQAILVERGWIPLEYTTPASWRKFDQPGTVSLDGIIRLSLEKAEMGSALIDPTLAPGETQLDFWNFVNIPRLEEQFPYSLLRIYIQQAPGTDLESLPYRLMELPDLDPGAHIGFALQWFFYAGLLFFGYPVWLKNQKIKTLSENIEG